MLEGWIRDNPEFREKVDVIEVAAIPHFEMIEDEIYQPGTIERVRELQLKLLSKHRENLYGMANLIERGYGRMAANSDTYLDWYYSLPAEYIRLGALITGNIEDRIQSDLNNYLGKGDPFRELNRAIGLVLEENEEMRAEYESAVSALMAANRVVPDVPEFAVDKYLPQEVMIRPVQQIEAIDFKVRATGAGIGAISGFVAAKVVAKVVAKGTVKLAGLAIAKAAATKVGAGSAGAAMGALIGSVIPGAGTLVGTGIGAIVGVMIGVSIDVLLLTVEEMLTRDQFAKDLAAALYESKIETYKSFGLVPHG